MREGREWGESCYPIVFKVLVDVLGEVLARGWLGLAAASPVPYRRVIGNGLPYLPGLGTRFQTLTQ